MNNKITIFELLRRINDKEKLPQIISYNRFLYYLSEYGEYLDCRGENLKEDIKDNFSNLYDYIEILDEERKVSLVPEHISNQTIQQMKNEDCKCIAHKVNEILNYLMKTKNN